MRRRWGGDPEFRRAFRAAIIGFVIALIGVVVVFIGQAVGNAILENLGALIALAGLAITALSVLAGFVFGLRSLWRRTG